MNNLGSLALVVGNQWRRRKTRNSLFWKKQWENPSITFPILILWQKEKYWILLLLLLWSIFIYKCWNNKTCGNDLIKTTRIPLEITKWGFILCVKEKNIYWFNCLFYFNLKGAFFLFFFIIILQHSFKLEKYFLTNIKKNSSR